MDLTLHHLAIFDSLKVITHDITILNLSEESSCPPPSLSVTLVEKLHVSNVKHLTVAQRKLPIKVEF